MAVQNMLQPHHVGILPIRVLGYDLLHYFQNTHLDFRNELLGEVGYNHLKRNILYDVSQEKIRFGAQITYDRQIQIEESYLAFLWSLAHIVATLFYEQQSEDYKTNLILKRAESVFNYGFSLFKAWNPWDLSLPNPEQYDINVDPYVEKANGLFINAGKFILSHEYAHHYLDHFTDNHLKSEDELKDDEFKADTYACQIIMQGNESNSDMGYSIYLGVLIGIASILFFNNGSWDGGDEHPDTDKRMLNILEEVSEDENDDIWKFATVILLVWGGSFNKNVELVDDENAKGRYLALVEHLRNQNS